MLASSPFRTAVFSALRKVGAVMDNNRLGETAALASRVLFLHDEALPALADGLAEAFLSGSVMRIDYADRDGAETTRTVEPMGYVGRGSSWYLIGWCRLRDGLRAFRGDRIIAATATGERPPRRPFNADDLNLLYGYVVPAYPDPNPT